MGLFDKFKKTNNEEHALIKLNTQLVHQEQTDIISTSNIMLMETCAEITENNSISIPIGKLATLGGGVSSLLPALRTVTQTTTVGSKGLYKLANEAIGDTLKVAKNGNFWGAFKTAEGKSKFVQLTEAGPINETTKTVLPLDPATIMMAAALYSIEKQLDEIIEMEKQILSFLEQEKESEIEADLKTLTRIIQEYKFNWNKEQFISSYHKLVLDIKRTAEKNMIFFQKEIADIVKKKKLLVQGQAVDSTEKVLEKKFKYYRLSLYIYSLASFLEVMLLGNFQEEYIGQVRTSIEEHSQEYNQMFQSSSKYLDKVSGMAIEANVIEGIGTAGKAIGNFVGSIPLVKEGKVDEWLVDSGEHLKHVGQGMKKKVVNRFEMISDAGTETFVMKLNEVHRIYNNTKSICFDNENIYLVENC